MDLALQSKHSCMLTEFPHRKLFHESVWAHPSKINMFPLLLEVLAILMRSRGILGIFYLHAYVFESDRLKKISDRSYFLKRGGGWGGGGFIIACLWKSN